MHEKSIKRRGPIGWMKDHRNVRWTFLLFAVLLSMGILAPGPGWMAHNRGMISWSTLVSVCTLSDWIYCRAPMPACRVMDSYVEFFGAPAVMLVSPAAATDDTDSVPASD